MNGSVWTSGGLKTISRPNECRSIVYGKGSIVCQWRNGGLLINDAWNNWITIQKRKVDWFHPLTPDTKIHCTWMEKCILSLSFIVMKHDVKSRSYQECLKNQLHTGEASPVTKATVNKGNSETTWRKALRHCI